MKPEEIKSKLFKLMQPRLQRLGIQESDIDEHESLLGQGVFDSMAFIEFITQMEEEFDIEMDFEEMDASDFTSVSQLINIINSFLS